MRSRSSSRGCLYPAMRVRAARRGMVSCSVLPRMGLWRLLMLRSSGSSSTCAMPGCGCTGSACGGEPAGFGRGDRGRGAGMAARAERRGRRSPAMVGARVGRMQSVDAVLRQAAEDLDALGARWAVIVPAGQGQAVLPSGGQRDLRDPAVTLFHGLAQAEAARASIAARSANRDCHICRTTGGSHRYDHSRFTMPESKYACRSSGLVASPPGWWPLLRAGGLDDHRPVQIDDAAGCVEVIDRIA
jgi:hypothetical protein